MLYVKVVLTSPIIWKGVTYNPSLVGEKVKIPEEAAIANGLTALLSDQEVDDEL